MNSVINSLRVGFIEPHLERYGGIRRVLELANRLIARGHAVTFYLPDNVELGCSWMTTEARMKRVRDGVDDELDVVIFNHELQWHLATSFRRTRASAFYALHYGAMYDKPGSWESAHANVDLLLANSTWTADRIEEETGQRPVVLLGGINPEHFRPSPKTKKRYPILAVGDERAWKGTDTIRAAAKLLGLPLETYAEKDLPQSAMAEEYARAEVFVVGSDFEGFGQPGLEALACGVPLVTTDNGGCRDYAIHERTALLVPPGDAQAMARAIKRLRDDPALAERLIANGLELVRERFDWDRSAEQLDQHLHNAVISATEIPHDRRALRVDVPDQPALSVVVLQWNQLKHTQRCLESIRRHTDVPYELILVDNGSEWEAANYARAAADTSILNPENRGFGEGMNQGLEAARGDYVAFVNNDTVLPVQWASTLTSHLRAGSAGIVVPAVTNARDPRIVRREPGDAVEALLPFEAPPPAVMYVMRRDVVEELGGWGREYEIASGEDMDLCFKVWANRLDVVFDSRVLVDHVSKGTAEQLEDWRGLWSRNRQVFLDKWTSSSPDVPRLETCSPDDFATNLRHARAAAGWMTRFFDVLDRLGQAERKLRKQEGAIRNKAKDATPFPKTQPDSNRLALAAWKRVRPLVPTSWRRALFARYKNTYYERFPEQRAAGGGRRANP